MSTKENNFFVLFIDENGEPVNEPYIQYLEPGQHVHLKVPKIEGYAPNISIIDVNMPLRKPLHSRVVIYRELDSAD